MFYLKTLTPGGTDFLLRIPLEVVWLYLLHFESIFMEGVEVWVKVHLFAHRHPTVPARLLKGLSSLHRITFALLQKSAKCICVGLFLASLLWSIDPCVCPLILPALPCLMQPYSKSQRQGARSPTALFA